MAGGTLSEVTDASFEREVLAVDLPVVIDFWASWCHPCLAMAPVLAELAEEYSGRVKMVKVDTDRNPGIVERYQVMGLPALVFLRGGKPLERLVGPRSKGEIAERLDLLLQEPAPRDLTGGASDDRERQPA